MNLDSRLIRSVPRYAAFRSALRCIPFRDTTNFESCCVVTGLNVARRRSPFPPHGDERSRPVARSDQHFRSEQQRREPDIDGESEQQRDRSEHRRRIRATERPIRGSMANPNNSIPESEQRHSRIHTTFPKAKNIFPNLNNNVEHFQKLFS